MENIENNFRVEKRNKLNHHIRNLIAAMESHFELVKSGKKTFNKNFCRERVGHHIEGIHSTFSELSEDKIQVFKEFCQIAARLPNEIDDKYIENLYSKFNNEIKAIIESL